MGKPATAPPKTTNAFIGWTETPTDSDLARALGRTKPLWDGLIADVAARQGATTQEWKCYWPKMGWSMRLARGKRTIVWLAPMAGCFQVMFILSDKALAAARKCGLSAAALQILDEAPKYPEGTGVRLMIKAARDIPTVRKLAAVKLEN